MLDLLPIDFGHVTEVAVGEFGEEEVVCDDCWLLLNGAFGFGVEFGPCGEVDGVFLPPLGGAVGLIGDAAECHELGVVAGEEGDEVEGFGERCAEGGFGEEGWWGGGVGLGEVDVAEDVVEAADYYGVTGELVDGGLGEEGGLDEGADVGFAYVHEAEALSFGELADVEVAHWAAFGVGMGDVGVDGCYHACLGLVGLSKRWTAVDMAMAMRSSCCMAKAMA